MANTSELRVQAGKQTVWTTGVAPTVLLRGLTGCKINPDQEINILSDLTLNLTGGDTPVITKNGGGASVEGWASYEDLGYWFDTMFGEATAGASPGYARAYAAPVTTLPSPRIISLVHGDGTVGAYKLIGGIGNTLTFKVSPTKESTFSVDLIGSTVDPATLQTGLATRAVIPVMAGDVTTMFLDTWAGTMGTTALTKCSLRDLALTINSNRQNRYCVGGVNASDYITKPWDGMLDLLLEWNATSKALIDEMVGGAAAKRQFEINFSGGTNKALKLQFAGTLNAPPSIFEDDDGVIAVKLQMKNTYHPTFANWFKAVVTAAVQTLA